MNFFLILSNILSGLLMIVPLLIAVAYLTLMERKVMASMQQRRGPNVVGIYGLLQPLADGLKLLTKETVLPNNANIIIFILAPLITFILALVGWAVIPFAEGAVYVDLNIGLLYIFAISSLAVYGIITAGWGSNSKYAFLGALRSAAQMISYEVSIGFIIITVVLCSGSMNLTRIVMAQENNWYVIPLFPLFIMYYISALAETNRAPFDLPEAEAELVAGYNVEYSAITFVSFFLAEYTNILLMSSLFVIFFLGGGLVEISRINIHTFISNSLFNSLEQELFFSIKTIIITFFFIFVRANLPRFRFDQLMFIGWKIFLPLTLGFIFFFFWNFNKF